MSGPLVAVLDYGIGNLRSAQKALESVGADARLTDDPDVVSRADGVVLPGVGGGGRGVGAPGAPVGAPGASVGALGTVVKKW